MRGRPGGACECDGPLAAGCDKARRRVGPGPCGQAQRRGAGACDLAVGRYFGASYGASAVTELVSFLRQADQAGGEARHGQREMEAVIRHALAEAAVDVSGIDAQVAFEIQGSVTAFIAWQLAWPPPVIDALLAKAEQIAAGRGWNPPPAT